MQTNELNHIVDKLISYIASELKTGYGQDEHLGFEKSVKLLIKLSELLIKLKQIDQNNPIIEHKISDKDRQIIDSYVARYIARSQSNGHSRECGNSVRTNKSSRE